MRLPATSIRAGRLMGVSAVLCVVGLAVLAGSARPAGRSAGLIAFTRPDGLYVMRPDGSGLRLLRRGIGWARWSPDGQRLAYTSWSNGKHAIHGGLYVINADGTHPVLIVKTPYEPSQPTWSPDGRRLAFVGCAPGHRACGIWIVNADGSSLHKLALRRVPKQGITSVDWSPTGTELAVGLWGWNDIDGWGVAVVAANGGTVRNLLPELTMPIQAGEPSDAGEPAWSPDGRRLAFTYGGEIWTMDSNGGSRLQLTHNHVLDHQPTWSPDGSKIAFIGAYAGVNSAAIYLINTDGTGFTRLTHSPIPEARPSWQPIPSTPSVQSRASPAALFLTGCTPNGPACLDR